MPSSGPAGLAVADNQRPVANAKVTASLAHVSTVISSARHCLQKLQSCRGQVLATNPLHEVSILASIRHFFSNRNCLTPLRDAEARQPLCGLTDDPVRSREAPQGLLNLTAARSPPCLAVLRLLAVHTPRRSAREVPLGVLRCLSCPAIRPPPSQLR